MATSASSISSILRVLSDQSRRPRYTFMVLNLLSEVADERGQAGPFVEAENGRTPVREWLCEQLMPVSEREDRRSKVRETVRGDLEARHGTDTEDERIERAVRERAVSAGKTNISRAVSDLVRAGFVRRHYAGWRKDHANRGAGRHAVYTVEADTLAALRRRDRLI